MDTNPVAGPVDTGDTVRRDVVERLRREVVTGSYEPPADALADRIVRIVLARRRVSPPGRS